MSRAWKSVSVSKNCHAKIATASAALGISKAQFVDLITSTDRNDKREVDWRLARMRSLFLTSQLSKALKSHAARRRNARAKFKAALEEQRARGLLPLR